MRRRIKSTTHLLHVGGERVEGWKGGGRGVGLGVNGGGVRRRAVV